MAWQIAKFAIAAVVITFTSWLAGRQPKLAGFLMALPISSMLALILFHAEYHDSEKAVAFAKSIFVAVPISLLFFVPFLLADKLKWPFFGLYISGILLLSAGYAVHVAIVR
jgi:hypothetical protein